VNYGLQKIGRFAVISAIPTNFFPPFDQISDHFAAGGNKCDRKSTRFTFLGSTKSGDWRSESQAEFMGLCQEGQGNLYKKILIKVYCAMKRT
jgi:hypothetical protein